MATNKVVGDPSNLTLVLADSQPVGTPSNLAARAFADSVQHRSSGAISVSVWADASHDPTDDVTVIAGLLEGRFDLALVPTRAWVAGGVQSMDALQAPFEIASLEHMAAVAGDDDLAAELFLGLPEIGAEGIALLPESLRFLFSYGDPVQQPDDLRGANVWSITPDAERLLAPLGMTVVGPADGDLQDLLEAGSVDAAEADFGRATTSDSLFATAVTGDLPVFPKFLSLVANAERWHALDDGQRATLIEAATEARDHIIDDSASIAAQTALFCDREGAVVVAGRARLAAFRDAVAPVVADMDHQTLAAIRRLAPTSPTEVVTACDGRPHSTPRASAPEIGAFPDGIYRLEWNADFAASWNETRDASSAILFNEEDLGDLPAVITWTMTNGRYDFSIEFRGRDPFIKAGGVYRVDGSQLRLDCLPEICAGTNVLKWSAAADGTLTMRQVDSRPLDPYYAVPWVRVGDARPTP
ncbi:MAG: TRAP transporter substrate-binding protein DctP [Ilumatobacteraceae bacterium]